MSVLTPPYFCGLNTAGELRMVGLIPISGGGELDSSTQPAGRDPALSYWIT